MGGQGYFGGGWLKGGKAERLKGCKGHGRTLFLSALQPFSLHTFPMRRFKGTVLAGHKGLAVEVPFEPATPARPLAPGRRGHPARGTVNGAKFESAVVPRSRRYWLLLDDELGVREGDEVNVALELL